MKKSEQNIDPKNANRAVRKMLTVFIFATVSSCGIVQSKKTTDAAPQPVSTPKQSGTPSPQSSPGQATPPAGGTPEKKVTLNRTDGKPAFQIVNPFSWKIFDAAAGTDFFTNACKGKELEPAIARVLADGTFGHASYRICGAGTAGGTSFFDLPQPDDEQYFFGVAKVSGLIAPNGNPDSGAEWKSESYLLGTVMTLRNGEYFARNFTDASDPDLTSTTTNFFESLPRSFPFSHNRVDITGSLSAPVANYKLADGKVYSLPLERVTLPQAGQEASSELGKEWYPLPKSTDPRTLAALSSPSSAFTSGAEVLAACTSQTAFGTTFATFMNTLKALQVCAGDRARSSEKRFLDLLSGVSGNVTAADAALVSFQLAGGKSNLLISQATVGGTQFFDLTTDGSYRAMHATAVLNGSPVELRALRIAVRHSGNIADKSVQLIFPDSSTPVSVSLLPLVTP